VLIWGGFLLLGWIIVRQIPRLSFLTDVFLARSGASLGGSVNMIIAYFVLVCVYLSILISPYILFKITNPVIFIALIIVLFPFFVRSNVLFGITGFTSWHGGTVSIFGIALFTPILLIFLLIKHPVNISSVWSLPSSKAFLVFAVSGILMQFLFFPFISAIPIGYLLIGCQLLWYLIIVAYVKTINDVYLIIWGISIALVIGSVISSLTGVQEFVLNPIEFFQTKGRLNSMLFGSQNEYPGILVGVICLLPILFYKSSNPITKTIVIIFSIILLRDLLLSVTRGAFLALFISIWCYYFSLHKNKKFVLIFFGLLLIFYYSVGNQIMFFILERRGIPYSARTERWIAALEALKTLPYFFTGFGMATLDNIKSLLVHYPHNGFLFIWVNSGLVGLIGFILWLGIAVKRGIKIIRSTPIFEEKLLMTGFVVGIFSLIIFSMTTGFRYTGGELQEMYAIFTTQVALLIVLGQKQIIIRQQN